jgi:polyhydroxyalkanoate synthesis regulator phasin
MKKTILILCVWGLLVGIANNPVMAGEVDTLINKLVEKGILSPEDAKEVVAEIKNESAKGKAKKKAEKKAAIELPEWLEKIKLSGDLRLRYDGQWQTKDSGDSNRNRERFRLRAGLKAQINETTEMGIRLASGSGYQNTTNQSFDGHGRGKKIFIDQAYAKWAPTDYFTLLGGKHKNNMFTTPLVWDPDVNPEGLGETFTFKVNEDVNLFANLGQWVVEEQKSTESDPILLAYQFGTIIKPSKSVEFKFGAGFYDFLKMRRYAYDEGDLDDDETFIGYNSKTQQMVFDSEGNLLNEFGVLELQAQAKFKDILPVPFSVFGSYISNLDADIHKLTRDGVAYPDTDPADLLAYGGDDRSTGWLIGFDLGNKKKKGDWYFKYWYQALEDYAFPAVFVDSDFHNGGTNNKGHKFHGRYYFTNKIYAQATGYLTEREDERKDGLYDEERLQLDVIFMY